MTYQLQPFNEPRFDAGMAWLAKEFDRPLTQYDVVKIHALADIQHVLQHHRPIIGGTLRKLKYGPVDLDALNRAKEWKDDESAPFTFTHKRGNAMHFARKPGPTREATFTQSERDALVAAARTVFGMTFEESQDFFHSTSYVGRAWDSVSVSNGPIDWETIIEAYAKEKGEDAESLKDLVCV